MSRLNRKIAIAFVVAFLSGCGGSPSRVQTPPPSTMPAMPVPVASPRKAAPDERAQRSARIARAHRIEVVQAVHTLNVARVLLAVAARAKIAAATATSIHPPGPVAAADLAPPSYAPLPGASSCSTPATTDTPTIAACIKACESGNYSESSHTNDGSGAYQFIPRTWRTYFAPWRDEWNAAHPAQQVPYYDLAYEAPAWVQDAVLEYAVGHGGAGNWSPRFGNDPCTVRMS